MFLGGWAFGRRGRLFSVAFVLCLSSGCASSPAFVAMGAEELWDEGVAAYNQEEWEDAIQMLERLVAQNPDTRGARRRECTSQGRIPRAPST
jgi:outer membrane protein assembly factor BamD (BamD/ComL family)